MEGRRPMTKEPGAGVLFVGGHGPLMRCLHSLPVLAVRRVGGCCGGRPAAHQEWGAALRAFSGGQRVLERAAGEGLRQVSKAWVATWGKRSCLFSLTASISP